MMKHRNIPEEMKDLLSYDPETGLLKWKIFRGGGAPHPGAIAGTPSKKGYISILLRPHHFKAHRIAWFLHYGEQPGKKQIDHINGDKADNRICNLRLAAQPQNSANTGPRSNNKVGFKGVHYIGNRTNAYRAVLRTDGSNKHLGVFPTPEEASAAYEAALKATFGEFARVR